MRVVVCSGMLPNEEMSGACEGVHTRVGEYERLQEETLNLMEDIRKKDCDGHDTNRKSYRSTHMVI